VEFEFPQVAYSSFLTQKLPFLQTLNYLHKQKKLPSKVGYFREIEKNRAFLISDFNFLGIDKIHELGGKVNLAYGGQYQQERRYGISAENGGGGRNIAEDKVSADQLARWSICRLRFFC
jgi:hypothetical protein